MKGQREGGKKEKERREGKRERGRGREGGRGGRRRERGEQEEELKIERWEDRRRKEICVDLSLSQSCFQSNMSVITVVIRHILRAVPGHQSSQRHGCEIVLCQSSSDRNQSQHTLDSDTVDPLLEPSHTRCTLEEERKEGGKREEGVRRE